MILKSTTALLLCLHAADANVLTLKTARSTVTRDRARQGAVVSIVDNASGTEFVNRQAAGDLFLGQRPSRQFRGWNQ